MSLPTGLARQAIRAAVKIRERLTAPAWTEGLEHVPRREWETVRQAHWRLRQAESRGWSAAGREVLSDLDHHLMTLVARLQAFRTQLAAPLPASRVSSSRHIAADLAALEDEFERVQIDLGEKTVTVQTEPIVLEDLWLGPFDICLWWERIGVRRAYEVIAKDPQPPSGNDDVTHPHVRSNLLCEGEAAAPIQASLAGGRLFDFFLLVRQTLETYNSASPYVALRDWQGRRCLDCGWNLDEDDASRCATCEGQLCGECSTYCEGCGEYFCRECSAACSACERSFCNHCLVDPPEAANRLCANCHKKEEESHDNEPPDDAPAAIYPLCLGQAAAAA